jgi:hypothetical protein
MTRVSYNKYSQILCVQNVDARTTWRPVFNHSHAKSRVHSVSNFYVISAEWVWLYYGFRLNDDSACRRMILYQAIPVKAWKVP